MKIGVYEINNTENKPSHVTSVNVSQEGADCVVIINTLERWAGYHYQGGSCNPEARELLDKHPEHISFQVDPLNFSELEADHKTPMASHQTEVILFAENEAEVKLIRGIKYVQQDDDQIVFLIQEPKPKVGVILAQYRSPDSKPASPRLG